MAMPFNVSEFIGRKFHCFARFPIYANLERRSVNGISHMICCHQIGELKRILPLFLLQQDKKACAKIFDTDAVLPADEYDALQDFIGHSHVDVLPWGERIPRHTTKP